MARERLTYHQVCNGNALLRDYSVYDPHIHSEPGHGCNVEQAVTRLYERGLQGGAVLGHTNEGNYDRARTFADSLAERLGVAPLALFWANELSTKDRGIATGHVIVLVQERPSKMLQGDRPVIDTIMETYDVIPGEFAIVIPHPEHRVDIQFPVRLSVPSGVVFDEKLCDWLATHPEYRKHMGIEVANHASLRINPVSLRRVTLLKQTFNLAELGGSDAHQPKHVGGAATAVPKGLDFFTAIKKHETIALLAPSVGSPGRIDFYLHGGLRSRIKILQNVFILSKKHQMKPSRSRPVPIADEQLPLYRTTQETSLLPVSSLTTSST